MTSTLQRSACVLLALDEDGMSVGFVEATKRDDFVNGTETSPVAFLEGLYVQPSHRRRGVSRMLVSNRGLVMNVMQGFVETIHLFKTRPDVVVPLLQRYVKIEDRKVAEDLYAFHVPVFQKVPRPSFPGMQACEIFS